MERLTIMTANGAALKMDDAYPDKAAAREDLMKRYRIAIDCLAAYEDTGLTPEGVTDLQRAWNMYGGEVGITGILAENRELKETRAPKCYSEDIDGEYRYLVPDGDDEPIGKCKRCPLCHADKRCHRSPPTAPLTLEELREMDGEPVWVKRPGYGRKWALVHVFAKSTDVIRFTYSNGSMPLAETELFGGGHAYRRKPEEVQNEAADMF